MIYERSVTGIQIDPYDESAVYSPHKIQIIGETDEVIGIEQILKEKFPYLSICRSHANFLEVMHKSATKGNAVRFLEDYFHVKMEECVAFGDNFNDLDMLESNTFFHLHMKVIFEKTYCIAFCRGFMHHFKEIRMRTANA